MQICNCIFWIWPYHIPFVRLLKSSQFLKDFATLNVLTVANYKHNYNRFKFEQNRKIKCKFVCLLPRVFYCSKNDKHSSVVQTVWWWLKGLNAGGRGRSKNVIACHLFTYIFNKFVRVFLTSLIFIEVCYCLAATQSILNNINITFYIKYKLESYTNTVQNIYQPQSPAAHPNTILDVNVVEHSSLTNNIIVQYSYIACR